MNSLNSILLEGVVQEKITEAGIGTELSILFDIKSTRNFRLDNKIATKDIVISIKTDGRLAEDCKRALRFGTEVRIVGRIDVEATLVYIHAEHVEIKRQSHES